MAQVFTAEGKRSSVTPANKAFTTDELKGIVGGPLDIYELPGDLYAVTLHKAKEIGADVNEMAMAGHMIHLEHLERDGLSKSVPAPEFYGTVVFCKPEELDEETALNGKAEA